VEALQLRLVGGALELARREDVGEVGEAGERALWRRRRDAAVDGDGLRAEAARGVEVESTGGATPSRSLTM
jgi:hypothetical protein